MIDPGVQARAWQLGKPVMRITDSSQLGPALGSIKPLLVGRQSEEYWSPLMFLLVKIGTTIPLSDEKELGRKFFRRLRSKAWRSMFTYPH